MHLRLHLGSLLKSRLSLTRLTPVGVAAICMVILFVGFTQYQRSKSQATRGAAPVAYWKLDEGVGTTIYDSASTNHGYIGSGNSTPTWAAQTACLSGTSCLLFDGTNDYVGITSVSAIASNNVTFSFWIKSQSEPASVSGWESVVAKGNNSIGWYLTRCGTSGDVCMRVDTSAGNNQYSKAQIGTVFDNNWHHIAYTIDSSGGLIKGYLDGSLRATSSYNVGAGVTSTSPFMIGYNAVSTFSKGYIDDVKLYDYVRTADQIKMDYSGIGTLYGSGAQVRADQSLVSGTVNDFTNGLLGYWKMDEASWNGTADEVIDSSTYGGNGTGGNGVSTTAAVFGNGGSFDGSDDYVTVADDARWDFDGKSATIAVWFKTPGSDQTYPTLLHHSSGGSAGWNLRHVSSTRKINFQYGASPLDINLTTPSGISDNVWHHVATVIDDSLKKVSMYIDGSLTTETTYTSLVDIDKSLEIGGRATAGYTFTGSLDDVRIYDRAMDATEVAALYQFNPDNVTTASSSTLQGFWKFDEGVGRTTYDWSNNSLIGTLGPGNSSPTWTTDSKFGKALTFDGTNDYVTLGTPPALTFTSTSPFSVSAWIKPNVTRSGAEKGYAIAGKRDSNSPYKGWLLYLDYNSFSSSKTWVYLSLANNWGSNWIVAGAADHDIPNGQWIHVVSTYDGSGTVGGIKIYLNGKNEPLYQAANNLTLDIGNTAPFNIGADNNLNDFFKGQIDQVKVYDTELTAAQVKLEYNEGNSIVMGADSTSADGTTPSYSYDRKYCIPGDTSTCRPPVLDIDFNEGVGVTAFDTSGNGSQASLVNSPKWAQGKTGSAVVLNGTNQYLVTPDSNLLDIGTSSLTFEFWFKLTSSPGTGYIALLSKGNDAVTPYWSDIDASTNVPECSISWNSGLVSTNPVSLNEWHHMACVYDRTNNMAYMYIDGKLDTYGSRTDTPVDDNTQITLGAWYISGSSYSEYLPGYMDDVRIYKYARSAAQIAWDYNKGGPVAWYKMDDCSGSTIYDWSGNRINGVLNLGASGVTSTGTCAGSAGAWLNGATGKYSSSISLDGTDDYISVAHTEAFNFTDNLTISAWIKPTSFQPSFPYLSSIVMNGNGIENYTGFDFRLGDATVGNRDKLMFVYGAGGSWHDSTALGETVPLNTWSHVAVTYDKQNVKIYLNGRLISTTAHTDSITANSQDLMIGDGVFSSYRHFGGQIDDVRLYNYALTAAQIKAIKSNGAVRFE